MTKNLNKFLEWGVLAMTRRISTTPRLPLGRLESQSAFGQEIHQSTLADKGGFIRLVAWIVLANLTIADNNQVEFKWPWANSKH